MVIDAAADHGTGMHSDGDADTEAAVIMLHH